MDSSNSALEEAGRLSENGSGPSAPHYSVLFEHNPDPVYWLNASGRCIARNRAAEQFDRRPSCTGDDSDFWRLLPTAEQQVARAVVARVRAGEAAQAPVRMRAQNGRLEHFEITAIPVTEGGAFMICKNVTGRVEAEASLRESEQRYRALIDPIPDAVYTIDVEGRFITVNDATLNLTGLERHELIGEPFEPLLAPEDRAATVSAFQRALAGSPQFFHVRIEGRARRAFIAAISISPYVVDGRLIGVVGISRDVTEHKRAEQELIRSQQELRRLSGFLQSVQENERGRVARELHDELGQSLTALKLDVDWLAARLAHGRREQLTDKLQRMRETLDTTVESVRRLASNLRPRLLDELGLRPACEWLLQDFIKRTGLEAHLLADSEFRELSCDGAIAAFRVVQEALTNVARHAQAERVDVHLHRRAEHLEIVVADDGIGMSPCRERKATHGLVGMRERLGALGGTLAIDSAPGEGARLRATVPFAAAGDALEEKQQ